MNYWQGKLIRLRALETADAAIFFAWNQDSDMTRHIDWLWPPASLASQQRWVERATTQEPSDVLFLVMESLNGEVVGMISTHECDRRCGTFSYGVAVRAEHQRKGYAREAIQMLLRYYFQELRYQKVTAHVHSNNAASIELHEQLGFLKEGCIRRMIYSAGQYYDDWVYGMTIEEFVQNQE